MATSRIFLSYGNLKLCQNRILSNLTEPTKPLKAPLIKVVSQILDSDKFNHQAKNVLAISIIPTKVLD